MLCTQHRQKVAVPNKCYKTDVIKQKLNLKHNQWTARKCDQEWTGYHQQELYLTIMVQPIDTVMLSYWYKTKQLGSATHISSSG